MDDTSKREDEIRHLAPTVCHSHNKAMFIIKVQYYVHVILCFGMLQRAISMKLPFLLRKSAFASAASGPPLRAAPPSVVAATVEKVTSQEQKAKHQSKDRIMVRAS